MLKKFLPFIVSIFFVLIGGTIGYFFFSENEQNLLPYPNTKVIDFAGEEIKIDGSDAFIKQRFDKEYLITGNNLYQFYLYIKRYPLYIPYIEEELKKANIPDDFKYLPIAESALRDDVVSSAGAAGIWQFIPSTGERFGLVINEYVDERYNFEKSTAAAIEYITLLYDDFENWTLVAAAYNRGENGLKRALNEQQVDNYYDLYLNEETSRYVFRILAIKYLIQEYFKKKGIIDKIIGGTYESPDIEFITVGKIDNIIEWASQNGYTYREIKSLNPWILQNQLPEGEWKITIIK